jgi:hypothetical protein
MNQQKAPLPPQAVTPGGFAGFICEVTGDQIAPDDCLACARKGAPGCPMFPAAIEAIINSMRPQDHAMRKAAQVGGADFAISVTELVYCPRKHILAQDYPYYERPSAYWRMLRGTGIHELLSKAGGPGVEQTLVWRFKFQGKTVALTGTPDLVEDTPDGARIVDYKFTDYAPRDKKILECPACQEEVSKDLECPSCGKIGRSAVNRITIPAKPHGGHGRQVNLYGLLVEKVLGKPVAEGQVIYLTKTPVRINVPYERDATLAFVKERLAALLQDDLPPVVTNPDELWQCDYCPVRSQCEALHGGPVGK